MDELDFTTNRWPWYTWWWHCPGEYEYVYDNFLGRLSMRCSICGHERAATTTEIKRWNDKIAPPPPTAEQAEDEVM